MPERRKSIALPLLNHKPQMCVKKVDKFESALVMLPGATLMERTPFLSRPMCDRTPRITFLASHAPPRMPRISSCTAGATELRARAHSIANRRLSVIQLQLAAARFNTNLKHTLRGSAHENSHRKNDVSEPRVSPTNTAVRALRYSTFKSRSDRSFGMSMYSLLPTRDTAKRPRGGGTA